MNRRASPAGVTSLRGAIEGHEPLARLLRWVQQSRDHLEHLRPLLPPGLREQVTAGPLDETGWTLLVPGGAAASKLRQLLPTLEAALRGRTGEAIAIRIRVQGGKGNSMR